ncbi:MAG: hypothetical protein EWM45_17350 [Rhodopseudomonas palustris]|nr:MAG: hypothetical protein EWM45_17350 [Rhodopseudomonas palustris]
MTNIIPFRGKEIVPTDPAASDSENQNASLERLAHHTEALIDLGVKLQLLLEQLLPKLDAIDTGVESFGGAIKSASPEQNAGVLHTSMVAALQKLVLATESLRQTQKQILRD